MKKVLFFVFLMLAYSVFAENEVHKELKNAPQKKGKGGFTSSFLAASNFIFNDSRSVIGQKDGSNVTLGLSLKGGFNYLKKLNELQFNMEISQQFSRTPDLERFVKSSDIAKFDLSYLYNISKIWGPFVKVSLDTSLLPGYNETKDDEDYIIPDGPDVTTNSMKLVSSLQPMIFKQTAGLYYRPIKKKSITFQLNAGAGAMEVLADGGYALNDDDATDAIELLALKSYSELGSSIFMKLNGTVKSASIVDYDLRLELMTPFLNDDDQNRGVFELTNINFSFTVSSKVTSWLSVNYELKITKTPQLLDEFQIQNNIMLSLNYMLIGK